MPDTKKIAETQADALVIDDRKEIKLEPLTDNAYLILKDGIEKIDMSYWLSAGTALGFYREGDFIEGDTDIDIAVLGYFGIDKDIEKRFSDYELIRTVYYQGSPMQMAFEKDKTIFDIFIHWLENDYYVNYSGSGISTMERKMYEEPIKFKTKYGDVLMPNNPEKYLLLRYGENWKIPLKEKPKFQHYA